MVLKEAEERWILAALVTGVFLFLGDTVGRNPDGLEMIALARGWRGEGPPLEDAGYWPPLWPMLMAVVMQWLDPLVGGRLLNLMLAGATAFPLHGLACRVLDRGLARLCVVLYATLPSVLFHAPVLDARPLEAFLVTWCAWWLAEACLSGKSLVPAVVVAGLAGLARPEGVLLVPLVGGTAWLAGLPMGRVAPMLMVALLPSVLRPGADVRGWEAYTGAWLGIWPNEDILALFGPNTAPTGYRRFVQGADELGLVRPSGMLGNLWLLLPGGLDLVKVGLPQATGGLTLAFALLGLGRALVRGLRVGLVGLGWGLLVVPMVVLPMARDQLTEATNFMFLVPLLCVGVGFALAPWGHWGRAAAGGLFWLCVAEAWVGPFRDRTDRGFFESSESALAMEAFLRLDPPESGKIACRLPGRGVVRGAGLVPVGLPSGWERWEGDEVLLTSVDLKGTDGGRGLELLEDQRYEVVFFSFDGQFRRWEEFRRSVLGGHDPDGLAPSVHWLIYLRLRSEKSTP